jgi:hypothetical protein
MRQETQDIRDGVPGVPQDGVRDEPVGAHEEVVFAVVVGHSEALGCAAQRRGCCRREVELDAVAELGGQLECLGAAGEVREADAVHVGLLVRLQHHFLLSDLPCFLLFFLLPSSACLLDQARFPVGDEIVNLLALAGTARKASVLASANFKIKNRSIRARLASKQRPRQDRCACWYGLSREVGKSLTNLVEMECHVADLDHDVAGQSRGAEPGDEHNKTQDIRDHHG